MSEYTRNNEFLINHNLLIKLIVMLLLVLATQSAQAQDGFDTTGMEIPQITELIHQIEPADLENGVQICYFPSRIDEEEAGVNSEEVDPFMEALVKYATEHYYPFLGDVDVRSGNCFNQVTPDNVLDLEINVAIEPTWRGNVAEGRFTLTAWNWDSKNSKYFIPDTVRSFVFDENVLIGKYKEINEADRIAFISAVTDGETLSPEQINPIILYLAWVYAHEFGHTLGDMGHLPISDSGEIPVMNAYNTDFENVPRELTLPDLEEFEESNPAMIDFPPYVEFRDSHDG